jgi:hypothetical protein
MQTSICTTGSTSKRGAQGEWERGFAKVGLPKVGLPFPQDLMSHNIQALVNKYQGKIPKNANE